MSAASLPAAPLAAAVDRILARALVNEPPSSVARSNAYANLAIAPRTVFAWRAGPRATVSFSVADRVLSRTPYLWFDVWPECVEHVEPEHGCPSCLAYFRARQAFTGSGIPREMRRPA